MVRELLFLDCCFASHCVYCQGAQHVASGSGDIVRLAKWSVFFNLLFFYFLRLPGSYCNGEHYVASRNGDFQRLALCFRPFLDIFCGLVSGLFFYG